MDELNINTDSLVDVLDDSSFSLQISLLLAYQSKITYLSERVTELYDSYGGGRFPYTELSTLLSVIYELSDNSLKRELLTELLDKVVNRLIPLSPKMYNEAELIEENLREIPSQP